MGEVEGSNSVGGRERGSINIVLALALSHVCVTNRSSLVLLPPPPPFALVLSPKLPGNRVKSRLAGCLEAERGSREAETRGAGGRERKEPKQKRQRMERGSWSWRGERHLEIWDCALGMLMRWGHFLPPLFGGVNQQAALWMCGRFVLNTPAEQSQSGPL